MSTYTSYLKNFANYSKEKGLRTIAKYNTKDKILSVANKLFSQFGFHRTSMDEIAKVARKSKGSIYYYFTSKENLFTEIVYKEIINLENKLSVIVENSDLSASEKIKNYLTKRMQFLNNAVNYHETLKADFFEHFDFIDDLRKELDEWEKESLKKIILQGVKTNEFAPVEKMNILLDMFIIILKGLEIPFFLNSKYKTYSPHFEELIDILIKGLAP